MGYVLFDEIASGGMATVHFGRLSGPVGFSRVVAIKRLHKHLAREREFVSMFLDEARLAARVRHPNVIQTIDVVAEDEVFIVMEYVPGESLSRLVRAEKARQSLVPLHFALAIVGGTLHGLHAAHDAIDERGLPLGLVHRDISPQNILVGSDGVARVLDFGVAKAAGRLQDTRDGSLKGKVAYMSPEQLAGRDVTRRSDIYSASVMLWELLAGRRLFEADNEAAIIPKIMAPQLSPPSAHNPNVSAQIDEIVMRGLAFDPDRRYPTARAMAQDLEKNGGLVAPAEVGEWVMELGHVALEKRSRRIADIEARDVSDVGAASSHGLARFPEGVGGYLASGNSMPPNTPPQQNGGPTSGYASTHHPSARPHTIPPGSTRRMFADASANMPPASSRFSSDAPTHAVPQIAPPERSGSYTAATGASALPGEPATHGAMSMGTQKPKRRGGALIFLLLISILLIAGGGFAVWKYGPKRAGFLDVGSRGSHLDGPVPSAAASSSALNAAPSASASSTVSTVSTASSASDVPSAAPSAIASSAPNTQDNTSPQVENTASAKPPMPPPTTHVQSADSVRVPPRPTGQAPHGAPTTKTKPDECDPPYVIDADGHKAYKRNCLNQ